MNSTINVKTESGNNYIYDIKKKKLLYCHPTLTLISELINRGVDPLEAEKEKYPLLKDKNTVDYYLKKYQMLKEKGFWSTIDANSIEPFNLTPRDIKKALANTKLLTFEVTDKCNLNCKYCGYGELYQDYDTRENIDLEISLAKNLLVYMNEIWNSNLNLSEDKKTYVGFYGGEPLLNMPFIKEILNFCNGMDFKKNNIEFNMTTNGLLLDKHLDFLVKNEFWLLVSLDGDIDANSYRLTKGNQESFSIIYRNLKLLKRKYPNYFRERVNFNAVMHDRNNAVDIYKFFKKNFEKIPNMSQLNSSDIADSKIEEFKRMFNDINTDIANCSFSSKLEDEIFLKSPKIKSISDFILQKQDLVHPDYSTLLNKYEYGNRLLTGTCLPFSKKIFLTAKGVIKVCERISEKYTCGSVTEEGVNIDYDDIARTYNSYYDSIKLQCIRCYNLSDCSACIFTMKYRPDNWVCPYFYTKEEFKNSIVRNIDAIEEKPSLYKEVLNNVWLGQ